MIIPVSKFESFKLYTKAHRYILGRLNRNDSIVKGKA